MATTKNTSTAKRTTTKIVSQPAPEDAVTREAVPAPVEKETYIIKEYQPTTFVTVRNGFSGTLIYKSKRTGETFVWDDFGDEQDIELQELKNAKNSSKIFFENNWFLIDDPNILAYLGVDRFYKNALAFDNFDDLFEMSPDEIGERISQLSKGQKQSVEFRARQLIVDGTIDSRKVITALEKSLGVQLIEH